MASAACWSATAGESAFLQGTANSGNQQAAAFSMGPDGGFMVWQDDRIDGKGWGIGLRRLKPDFTPDPAGSVLTVNSQKSYDQESPGVACLSDGAAIVVWQGGRRGMKDVFYRKVSPRGTWLTEESFVNLNRAGDQVHPAVVALPGGDAFVAWTSVNQEGSYRGVFGRRIAAASGASPEQVRLSSPAGREDQSPALAALEGSGFVCVWLSGSKGYWRNGASQPGDSVVLARTFNSLGQPTSVEIDVSPDGGAAYGPKVASAPGGFVVGWLDRTARQPFYRVHSASGQPMTPAVAVAPASRYLSTLDVASAGGTIGVVWSDRTATDRNLRIYYAGAPGVGGALSAPVAISSNASDVLQSIQPTAVGLGDSIGVVWSSYKIGSAFDLVGTQIR